MVGYNFGPASPMVWAFQDVSANASGGTPVAGIDSATIAKGASVFANLNLGCGQRTPRHLQRCRSFVSERDFHGLERTINR